MKAHVSEKKKNEVKILKDLFKKYRVISIGDLTSLPSKQLQEIRRKLKDSLLIKVTKKRLIKRAISEFKDKDLSKLNDYLNCMPVLLFTNDDPFKLYRLLKKSKSKAPIKAGQIAPNDLIVKAGPTNFAPGPIIGELGQVGIIAGVEDGKIAIKKEKIVVKEGEEVSPKVANILAKLGEEPMEIGLNLKVAYEEGILYGKDILDMDEEKMLSDLKLAHNYSLNLAVKINYITKETVKILIRKAVLENNALENNEKVKKALETIETKEEVKEEPKVEEKLIEEVKEEPKVEEKLIEEVKEEPKEDEFEKDIKEAEAEIEDVTKSLEELKVEEKLIEEVKEEPKEDEFEKDIKEAEEEIADVTKSLEEPQEKKSEEEIAKEVIEKMQDNHIQKEEKKKKEGKKEKVPTAAELAAKKHGNGG